MRKNFLPEEHSTLSHRIDDEDPSEHLENADKFSFFFDNLSTLSESSFRIKSIGLSLKHIYPTILSIPAYLFKVTHLKFVSLQPAAP